MISVAADRVLSLRIPTPHKKAAAIAFPTPFDQPMETQRLAQSERLIAPIAVSIRCLLLINNSLTKRFIPLGSETKDRQGNVPNQ